MDRSRRNRNQSDEKQSTSLLIQQLAAQRERRLNATASLPRSSHVHEAASLYLPGSSADDDESEYSFAASATAAPAGGSKPGRNRLVRRDRVASPCNNDELEDLAGMMQDFGLSSKQHTSSKTAPRRKPLHMQPSAASRSSEQARGKQQQAVDLSSGEESDSARNTTTPLEGIEDSNTDDEPAAYIPRSRKPAAAVPLRTARRPAAAAADAVDSSSAKEREHDSDAGWTAAATAFVDAEAAESSADDYDNTSADETEATDSDADAGISDGAVSNSSSRSAAQQSSSSSSAAGSAIAAAAAAPAAGSLVLEGGFCLDAKIACKLYPHQVEGVKWLWSLHRMRKGGILADDMGLGKTMQCSAFLAGALQRSRHTFSSSSSSSGDAITSGALRALIIAPKTLLAHWEKELRVCGMGPRTHSFYGSSEGERCASLRAVTSRGGVMLTTYGMVLHNAQQLRAGLGQAARDIDEHEDEEDPFSVEPPVGRRILWDYVILDEGHKIKNARTQLAQRLRELRAVTRVIISGTPVQNNLAELHSLLDFAVPGLLGGPREFKLAFEKPITAGQDRSAGLRVREMGAAKAAELRRIVGPFMLRREKKEVFGSGASGASSSSSAMGGTNAGVVAAAAVGSTGSTGSTDGQATAGSSSTSAVTTAAAAAAGAPAAPAPMGVKHDLVVWLRLQPLQRHIYEAFLHSDAVKAALNSSRSPLAALTVLKKVCDHPALLSDRATKLVVSAASKQGKKDKGSSRQSSKPKGSKQRRDSLGDFIVDDSADESYQSGSEAETGSESDGSSSSSGGVERWGSSSSTAAAARSRAAVAASIDDGGYSEEFLSWAAAEGLEARLLDGIGKKGLDASCKALFVVDLLECLVAAGHRTLVFSQSRFMLDILQASVVAHGWSYCRIDGSMASTDARQAEVEKFQALGSKIPVFLLTTQVGGLGLTLTAANRVVIVDPSWNPATDNQSVDRAYRIGQSRDVVVYRLVTCGTVEEKIYRKQVFKGGLSKAGMEEGVQLRYFTHQELHELFKWDPAALALSETQQLLTQQHQPSGRDSSTAAHVAWLERHALCAGTSEHGLLFSHQDPEGKQLQLSQHDSTTVNNMQGGRSAAAAGRSGFGSYAYSSKGAAGAGGAVYGSSSSSSRGGSMAVNGAAAAAAGPSAGELSDMLSSLNIANTKAGGSGIMINNGGSYSPAAAAGGSGDSSSCTGAAAHAQELLKQRASLQVEVQHLQYQLNRVTTDLLTVGARLPDGGSKLKARQQELKEALEAAQLQLKELTPQQQQQQQAMPNTSTSSGAKSQALVDITNSAANTLDLEDLQQQQCQQQQQIADVGLAAGNGAAKPHSYHYSSGSGKSHTPGSGASPSGTGQRQQWQQQQQVPPPPPARPAQPQHQQQQWQQQQWQQQQWQQQQWQQQQWQQQVPPPLGRPVQPQRQQQQQQWQQQMPPPPPQQPQQQWQQQVPPPPPQQQQQPQWLNQPRPTPPPAEPADAKHQQAGSGTALGDSSSKGAAGSSSSSSSRNRANSSTPPAIPFGVETLDGRVPTVAELQRRKHVLKRALHEGDKLRAQYKAGGQKLPVEQQQQWAAMYQEYKEIKAALEQQAELLDAQGGGGGGVEQRSRCSKGAVEVVDLTL